MWETVLLISLGQFAMRIFCVGPYDYVWDDSMCVNVIIFTYWLLATLHLFL